MAQAKLMLDYVYEHEINHADQIFLTQPTEIGRASCRERVSSPV